MGMLRSALSAASRAVAGPAGALEVLGMYARSVDGALAATAVSVLVDTRSRLLVYSSAGHPPPVLLHADGACELLDQATDPPLGARPEHVPRPQAGISYRPGDTLVLYTDGLIERRDEDIDSGLGGSPPPWAISSGSPRRGWPTRCSSDSASPAERATTSPSSSSASEPARRAATGRVRHRARTRARSARPHSAATCRAPSPRRMTASGAPVGPRTSRKRRPGRGSRRRRSAAGAARAVRRSAGTGAGRRADGGSPVSGPVPTGSTAILTTGSVLSNGPLKTPAPLSSAGRGQRGEADRSGEGCGPTGSHRSPVGPDLIARGGADGALAGLTDSAVARCGSDEVPLKHEESGGGRELDVRSVGMRREREFNGSGHDRRRG